MAMAKAMVILSEYVGHFHGRRQHFLAPFDFLGNIELSRSIVRVKLVLLMLGNLED